MRITHLVDGLQGPRSELDTDVLLEGVGEETFVVDVGQPCPAGLVLRVRYVVAVLLRLALEETELRPLEGCADHRPE